MPHYEIATVHRHPGSKDGKMRRTGVSQSFVLKLGLCVLLALACAPRHCAAQTDRQIEAFAKCLKAKNVIMYGSFVCPHCEDQKKLFGGAFKFINYVECRDTETGKETARCWIEQIRFTPTWVFPSGQRLAGVQSLQRLGDASKCPLQ